MLVKVAPMVPFPNDAGHRSCNRRNCFIRLALYWREPLLVAAFYVLLVTVVLSPLVCGLMPETGAHDLQNHVSGIVEARNALLEGQFPIRVAPHQNNRSGYPIFQFYGNLPYTAGGLLFLTGVDPYRAWKIIMGGALVMGGLFTYRCCRAHTRRLWPSFVAGAVFLTAPYTLCDVHGRVAYSETISLGLLPAVFFYLMRAFTTRRWGSILASSLCWSCLALSHAVTFFLGSIFFGLYVLTQVTPTRKYAGRLLACGGGYFLGLALSAWYILPQLYLCRHLMGGLAFPLGKSSWLTPLGVLLAPTVVPPLPLPTIYIHSPMHFSLQLGWPILAAASMTVYALFTRRVEIRNSRGTAARMVLFFGLAFILVWTPFDFWRRLPRIFDFVQFSYRILMFVVLWGSLLAGYALKLFFRDGMRFENALVCLLLLGLYVSPALAPHHSPNLVSSATEIADPDIGRGGANSAYLLPTEYLTEYMLRHGFPPGFTPVGIGSGVVAVEPNQSRFRDYSVDTPICCYLQLPVLFYPHMLEVRDNGRRITHGNLNRFVAVPLQPGRHLVCVRFVGLVAANWLSGIAWCAWLVLGVWSIGRGLWKCQLWLRPDDETVPRLDGIAA
jgi:hypothetical protein